MNRFRKAIETIIKANAYWELRRKISAVTVLFAVMMPTAAPIPIWAYDLNLPPGPVDDGLRLTASGDSLGKSVRKFLSSLTSSPAALIKAPGNDRKEAEAGYSTAALEKRVAGIKTELGESEELTVGQKLSLAARPVDKKGNTVNGLAAKWQCVNPKVVRILNDSEAVAVGDGETKLAVRSGNIVKEITIKVAPRDTGKRSAASLLPDPEQPVLSEQQVENQVTPENNLGNPVGQTEMASQSKAAALRTRERNGSASYNFGIPVVSLPGRGIDASVGITYNSRLWNKSGDAVNGRTFTFDTGGSWLAPGFEMGFGEMISFSTAIGNGVGYMLTGPDGTRTQLVYKQESGGCANYESTDGTFVRTTICGIYTTSPVNVVFSDGTQVLYGSVTSSGKRFPTQITDRNGNMLTITYVQNDSQGKIASIRDTLNRYINFHYETGTTDKKLVAITAPGYDGGAERQVIRFYYADFTLLDPTTRFNGAVFTPQMPLKVLQYVYFPGTQTGYRYDYNSAFGMIYKIWQLRGMTVNSPTTTETGTVNDNPGTEPTNWAAWTEYNYPNAQQAGFNLTEVPTYTTRTDDWKGRTTAAAPITNFGTSQDVTPAGCEISSGTCDGTRTVTVTAPDGTRSISVSLIKPAGNWQNGLLDETRIESGSGQGLRVWSKTKLFWVPGADSQLPGRDNPRLDKVEVTNDANQTRATSFEYDIYNNQTKITEYDFAAPGSVGAELRRTEILYETGPGWINNRLLRLPKEVKRMIGTETVSKTLYEYDKNGESGTTALTLRADISTNTHNIAFNPSFPSQYTCIPGCTITTYCCHVIQRYNASTDYRGNVTKIIEFPDTSKPSTDPSNKVTTLKYDIGGNVVESSGSCGCDTKTTEFVAANQYAYPMSESRTGQNVPTLTTSATYDVPTGLVRSITDENAQKTDLTYNPNNLRPTRTDGPVGTGIWSAIEYNDSTYPYHVKTTQSLDATRSVSSWSFSNGRGQEFRSRSQTTNGYLSSEVEFDAMGRTVKTFNPHTVSGLTLNMPEGIKFTQVMERDGLGRAKHVKLQDYTNVYSYFDEATVTVTYPDNTQAVGTASRFKDQADKERRQIVDALGRVIRVDEPTGNGLGDPALPNQPTFYKYDGNDNLSKAIQSDGTNTQERLFKFDALSRLTHERQVEANATLDNNGFRQPSGGSWTGVYKYDTDSLLVEGFDARGVKTTFTYDGHNRVKTVTYTGETGYLTPGVTYTYDEAETGFYNSGLLTRVQAEANAGQGTPETVQNYDYDKLGQLVKHVQSIGNQTYQLEYGYNLAGQLVSEKYPSGRTVAMTVDNFGRLSTAADAQRTYLTGVTFNDHGLPSQINLGNGTHETFSFNDRLQMDSQSLLKGSEVLQKYDYSYGTVDLATGNVNTAQNNGQLGKIEGWIGTNKQWSQRFGYDELGRLKEAREYKQGDNGQLTYKQVFDFDRFGNLYRKAASNPTTGQQNPLAFTPIEESTTSGTGDIEKTTNRFRTGTTYDDAGQVVTDNKFRSMSFAYDANGRQVKATRTGVPDAWTVYDALGNRVATKINNIWQYVIYDAFGKVIAEYGQLSDGLGGVKYIQQDWQGSVRTVTNANGFVVSRTDHQAFGGEIGYGTGQRSIDQGYNVDKSTRQGYGLTERDEATGLDHTWFRKNENAAGRWTSPDPYKGSMSLDDPQSFNRYSYVVNQPTNFIDPSGLVISINVRSCGLFITETWSGEEWFISDVGYYCFESTVYFPSVVSGTDTSGGLPTLASQSNSSDDETAADCVNNALAKADKATGKAIGNYFKNIFKRATSKKTFLGVGIAILGVLTTPITPGIVLGGVALAIQDEDFLTRSAIDKFGDDAAEAINQLVADLRDCWNRFGRPQGRLGGL